MKKILSILLILFTVFVASAQTVSPLSAPADGQLGSLSNREYVISNYVSTYTINIAQGGLGQSSIRTVLGGGTIQSITPTATFVSDPSMPGNKYNISSGTTQVSITIKWNVVGEGYFAFRQETELSCFDDTYSIFYTKIVPSNQFVFSFGVSGTSCAGENHVLPLLLSGQELWHDDEIRKISYTPSTTNTQVQISLTKSDVIKIAAPDNTYQYNLSLSVPANQTQDVVVVINSTEVTMAHGGNTANMQVANNSHQCDITPLPVVNPILNDVSSETGLEVIGGTYLYKVTNWDSDNTYVWSIKTKLGATVSNSDVEFVYTNEKATAKFKVKGEYIISVSESTNGGCSGPLNSFEVSIEDFNLTGEVRDFIGDLCSNDTNGASILKLVYPKTEGLLVEGSTCDITIGGQTISFEGKSINATEFAFEIKFQDLSDNGINYIPTDGSSLDFTPVITNIVDGHNVKIANNINTIETFSINNSPTEGLVKHRVNIPGEDIWISSNYTRVTGDLSAMNGHSVYVGGKTKYNFVAAQSRTITWDVVNSSNTSVLNQACTISTDYQNNGGWFVVTVTWLDAAAGNNYYIAATESIENGCSTVSKYGPVSVLANNFNAELSVNGYTTNTIPKVDLNDQTKIPCVSLEEVEINGVTSYKTVVDYNLSVTGSINPWVYKFMIGIKYDYSSSVVDKDGVTNTISQQAKIESSTDIEYVEPTDTEMVHMSGNWATIRNNQTQSAITINRALDIDKGSGYAYVWIWVKEIKDRYGTIISNPNEMKRVAIIKQLPDTSEIAIN